VKINRPPDLHLEDDMNTKALLLSLGVLLWVSSAGCIFSPDDDGGGGDIPPPPELPFPDSEDQLMANFKAVYERMDVNLYGQLLHTNYQFKYKPEDVENLGLPSDFHNRDDELGIMTNIFSQQPVTNSRGDLVAAITAVTVGTLDLQTPWEDSTDPDFPNSRRRLYQVSLEFTRQTDNTIIVTGQQEFFVSSTDSLHSGIPKQYWQLVGQIDRTEHQP
jgi:hypothetical protein